ncbi:MAG TPA: glycine cleavage system protein GcvH [Thermotogota bacterium]|nr:glycine cleavage system protein GcvH [Thermotogota bacterium]HPJ88225.1 glycine cleavage system protein GcvH [Thermotogota bacterium]HPR96074.1 glycine cleavage system protein GcvH [Thermotogota bacterium]
MKKFTESHEWVELTDGIATIGITNHAQEQLGDIVYVDLPGVGDTLSKGDTLCSIESVKSANDVYVPVSGEVSEINEELDGTPEKINEAAETDGWICKIKISDEAEMEELLSEADYQKLIEE